MTTITIIERSTRRVVVARQPMSKALALLAADPTYTRRGIDYSITIHHNGAKAK